MAPGDKVRVKMSAAEQTYRGRRGEVISITGQTADVELDDEAITHAFNIGDLEIVD